MAQQNGIGQFQIGVSQIGTPPPFDVMSTVISQYANSPGLLAMVQSFAAAADQTANIDNFLDAVWDLQTARGFGLDIWARIVGVSRVLQVSATTVYLGFQEAGDAGLHDDTFGVAPFYQSQPLTSNYALSDDALRRLIFAKARANISDTSIEDINQTLLLLFPNRGVCYAQDNLNMTLTYVFGFALNAVDSAIVYNSGVLPRPSGVLAGVQIGVPQPALPDGAGYAPDPYFDDASEDDLALMLN